MIEEELKLMLNANETHRGSLGSQKTKVMPHQIRNTHSNAFVFMIHYVSAF